MLVLSLPLRGALPRLITICLGCVTVAAIRPTGLARAITTVFVCGLLRLLAGPMLAVLFRPGIRTVVRPTDEPRRVVTLVHGTYAVNAHWTRADSPLVSHLVREVRTADDPDEGTSGRRGSSTVYALDWSGENSYIARARAVERLETHIRDIARSTAGVPHFIIAHSHGGNVALNALREPHIASLITGVACLSTPFIYLRARHMGQRAQGALVGMVVLYALGVSLFGLLYVIDLIQHRWGDTWVVATMAVLLMLLWGVLVVGMLLFILFDVGDNLTAKARRVECACAVPASLAGRLLIIRSSADEASSLLAVWQFLSWLTSRTWAMGAEIVELGGEVIRGAIEVIERPIRAVSTSLPAKWLRFLPLLLGVALAAAAIHDRRVGYVFDVLDRVVNMLFLPSLLVAFVAPAFVIAWSLLLLPFGPEFVPLGPFLDISVEATPPGSWRVDHLPPVEASDSPRLEGRRRGIPGLLHSSTYDDPRAHALIAAWLRECPEAPN